jgi:hypothetical protein
MCKGVGFQESDKRDERVGMLFKEKKGILRWVDSDEGLKVQVEKMGKKIEWMKDGVRMAEKKRGKVRMNKLGSAVEG